MSASAPSSPIASALDALASAGTRWLWKSRLRDGMRARLPRGLALLVLVPLLAIAWLALGWVFGQPWKLPVGWVALCCPLPSVLYLGYYLLHYGRQQPDRREGLAVFDEQLDLKDRLQAADEFLAIEEPTPFMAAAIEDAEPAAEQARSQPLAWEPGEPLVQFRQVALMLLLALLLVLTGALLPRATRMTAEAKGPDADPLKLAARLPVPPENEAPVRAQKTVNPPEPKAQQPEEKMRTGAKGKPAASRINEKPSTDTEGREKISLGASEGGQTSQATSSGRASQSTGMPGNKAPASTPENKPAAKKKPKKPKQEKPSDTKQKKVEDQSGATAGRGSSSGSSRNPAATDWSSKDRTESADNEDFEQEEDVDDEESESEARGGLQPNLRDRRPPVNRDLSIGFGNQASPDANGRGGPSQRKKSRGVAGLVLGVPVPDHVKGQPNPGRVKINQERVQPQGEEMPPGVAADRGQRNSPAGHLSERTLDASMRHIVREFFIQTRAAAAQNTPSETSTP